MGEVDAKVRHPFACHRGPFLQPFDKFSSINNMIISGMDPRDKHRGDGKRAKINPITTYVIALGVNGVKFFIPSVPILHQPIVA